MHWCKVELKAWKACIQLYSSNRTPLREIGVLCKNNNMRLKEQFFIEKAESLTSLISIVEQPEMKANPKMVVALDKPWASRAQAAPFDYLLIFIFGFEDWKFTKKVLELNRQEILWWWWCYLMLNWNFISFLCKYTEPLKKFLLLIHRKISFLPTDPFSSPLPVSHLKLPFYDFFARKWWSRLKPTRLHNLLARFATPRAAFLPSSPIF